MLQNQNDDLSHQCNTPSMYEKITTFYCDNLSDVKREGERERERDEYSLHGAVLQAKWVGNRDMAVVSLVYILYPARQA